MNLNRDDIIAHFAMALIAAIVCGGATLAHAETGMASHYGIGDGFHGRRTASGERFNAYGMTAAHRTRPLGSHVTVTSVSTGRSVRVRISDRGPARWTGKVVDLSYGAARAIGLLGNGRVHIE